MAKPSTRNLAALPDIETLQRLCKSLAALEAILCREWEYRYYSYNKAWDADKGEEYFQMRNGQGDEFQILFSKHGAIINGLAHESEMCNWVTKEVEPVTLPEKLKSFFGKKETVMEQQIWKGVVDNVPAEFRHFIFGEPIKSIGTTFCIWRKFTDDKWNIGHIQFPGNGDSDGSQDLLFILDNEPATYKNWACGYYDDLAEAQSLPLKLVKHVYDFEPLTAEIILAINPATDDLDGVRADLAEIGYTYVGL